MSEKHAARQWVEEHFPSAAGSAKAQLILAYGAGLDAGLAEAQELLEEMQRGPVSVGGYPVGP